MVNTSTATNAGLLAEAGQMDFSCVSSPPTELHVENLRRRGIDILRISWSEIGGKTPAWKRLFSFGALRRSRSFSSQLTFADQRIRLDIPDTRKQKQITAFVPFATFKSVEVSSHRDPAKSFIRISVEGGREHCFGQGLSQLSMNWLRDRIILETAGLAWRPIHNVGKRTTKATINPDEQAYRQWKAGPNKLVNLYLEHAPSHISSLDAAMTRGDLTSVRQNAHWLKSSSAAVGASLLSELLQRLEIDLDIKSNSEVTALVAHILTEFEKVTNALSKLISSSSDTGEQAPLDEPSYPVDQTSEMHHGTRVLLVEDSLVNQEIAKDVLESAGCNVAIANDGSEAIAAYKAETFDIVFMDCQMSGMDGFNATKGIRQFERRSARARTPIVALTAHALMGDRDLCIASEMDDYLSKPFRSQDLLAILSKWRTAQDAVAHAVPGTNSTAHEAAEAGSSAELPTTDASADQERAADAA